MESIKDKAAIVGMGCVKFGENWGQSLEDMIIDAAYESSRTGAPVKILRPAPVNSRPPRGSPRQGPAALAGHEYSITPSSTLPNRRATMSSA